MSTKYARSKVLMLSATISDTPKSFHIFGYMLNLYKQMKHAKNWINGKIREDMNSIGKKKYSSINESIYPDKGSRIRIADIKNKFPSNQISADCYNISEKDISIVNEEFEKITHDMTTIKSKNNSGLILGKIIKSRQKIEIIKLDIIVDLINKYLENKYNVVVFVNFNKSIDILTKKFKTTCTIRGGQTTDERERNINNFQTNKSNLIICNIKSGGVGISLHDLHGRPRVSLISPSFSSMNLIQALGRISRAGSKSSSQQRIIYCANTVEEVICNRIKEKLQFQSKLNDNDMINIEK